MAEFNVRTPDTGVIDETSRSRGTGPNRTFETLFSGLTETAGNVMQIQDTQNQMQIQDEARQIFDSVNEEFGVSAPTPDGVSEGLEQIQTLQNALSQGKISEVNYYGRLATLSKQLRSKYPGYESVVDSTIQSVTGTRPANAYRDALFSEIGRLSSEASSEEKFRRQYIKENEGVIVAAIGEDFFNNPDAYDFDKVQSEVAKFKGRSEVIEAENKELTLMSKRGEFNDKRAARALDRDFSFITEATLSKAVGANSPSFQQTLDQFIAKGGGSPQELEQFIGVISQAETDLRAALLQRGREKYVASGLISNDQLNKSIEDALYPVRAAKEAVLGGDFKLAAKYATINKNISDRAMNDLLQDPLMRVGRGLSEIDNTLGGEFFTRNARKVDDIAMEIVGQTMAGRQDIIKKAVEHGDQKVSRDLLIGSFDALTDQNIQTPQVSNIVDQLFGEKALDFMDPRNVKAEDLETIYTRFLDPRVTKAIFEKGSAEDQQKYTSWAIEKFKAIPAFAAAAGDINSTTDNRDLSGLQVLYDDKANRIYMTVPDSSGRQVSVPGGNTTVYARATNAFNKALSVLDPILQASGDDRQRIMGSIIQDLSIQVDGVNPQAQERQGQPKTTFWGSVYDAMMAPVGDLQSEDARRQTRENFGMVVPEVEEDGGDIDFLFEQEDYDPLDEDAFAETPELMGNVGDLLSDRQANQTRENFGLSPRQPRGLEALVSSRKRGYSPDLNNLRPDVVSGLTQLQSTWGRELPIVSGFRDPARNKRAGGAKRSQHMHGNAVDIDVSNLSREERIELIQLARRQGWGGIGVYPNSLHLDKGSKRAWGPNYRNTSLPKWARDALK